MSRASLRKELSDLSAPQLLEVILDAYSARKEIKEYFDYYINPDVKALTEKYARRIDKELTRSKWHRSKARISVITKNIKEFESFMPGAESVIDLIDHTLTVAAMTEQTLQFTDPLFNGISRLVVRMIDTAENAGLSNPALEKLNKLSAPDYEFASRYMKRLIRETVEAYDFSKQIKE